MIKFVITGDRFLYKMVRHIVGSIVSVACGHLEVSDIQQALNGGLVKMESQTISRHNQIQMISRRDEYLHLQEGCSYLMLTIQMKLSLIGIQANINRSLCCSIG